MSAFDCLLPDNSEKFCSSCKTVKFVDEFHLRSCLLYTSDAADE